MTSLRLRMPIDTPTRASITLQRAEDAGQDFGRRVVDL